MFRFNATVMGYGNSEWMAHVLDVFPALVVHAADPQRDWVNFDPKWVGDRGQTGFGDPGNNG